MSKLKAGYKTENSLRAGAALPCLMKGRCSNSFNTHHVTTWTSKLVLKAQIAPKHGNMSTGQKITQESNQKDEIQYKIIFRIFVIIAAYCVQGDSGKNEL